MDKLECFLDWIPLYTYLQTELLHSHWNKLAYALYVKCWHTDVGICVQMLNIFELILNRSLLPIINCTHPINSTLPTKTAEKNCYHTKRQRFQRMSMKNNSTHIGFLNTNESDAAIENCIDSSVKALSSGALICRRNRTRIFPWNILSFWDLWMNHNTTCNNSFSGVKR